MQKLEDKLLSVFIFHLVWDKISLVFLCCVHQASSPLRDSPVSDLPPPPYHCQSPGIADACHCTQLYLDGRILTQALTLCSEHAASELFPSQVVFTPVSSSQWIATYGHQVLHFVPSPLAQICLVIYRWSCQFFWPPCFGSVFYLLRPAGFQYLCLKHNGVWFCWVNQSESPFPEGNPIDIYWYNLSLALALSLTLAIIF